MSGLAKVSLALYKDGKIQLEDIKRADVRKEVEEYLAKKLAKK